MPIERPQPIPVDLDPQPGTISGLGLLVETTLVRFVQRAINSVAGLLSEIVELGIEVFLEAAEEALVDINRPMIERLIDSLSPSNPVVPYLQAMLAPTHQAGFFSLGGFASAMGSSAAGSLLNILLRPAGYELDSQLHTARFEPQGAISAMWRGVMSPGTVVDQLKDLGWSEGAIEVWETLLRPLLNERDILILWLRGYMAETEARAMLHGRGFTDDVIDGMRQAMRPIVGADDLRTLYYRGEIGQAEFQTRLQDHGFSPTHAAELVSISDRLTAPGDLVELWRRGVLSDYELQNRLASHGFTPDGVAEIKEVGSPLTNLGEIVSLYWRGELDPTSFRDRIREHGYSDSQIEEIERLSHLIPTAGDLISMAVREAFRPDLVAEYNYLSEFPPEFADWLQRQGYDREWSERYWVAHWRLPSLTMAYEMFHRRIIDDSELDRLFAVSDIAPYWRQPLKDAAYRPLTRVDVRRMYGMGVLDEEAVYNSYLDLGYNPENARLMTEFTVRYESTEDREATKADILTAYRKGAIDRGRANQELTGIGYPAEWAEIYLLLEEIKRAEDLLDTEIDILEDQYVDGLVARSDVYSILGSWDLPSSQIENYLEMWDITKRRKVAVPTVTQLENHLKRGIITEDQYTEAMLRRHYEETSIANFLQEIRIEIAEEAVKEEERARAEDQRARTTTESSAYEVERAGFDLQIATLKVAIAEAKILIGQLTDWDLIDALFQQIDQFELTITQLNEDKARSKLTHQEELQRIRG